jgi:hypothetical protein
LLTPSPFIPLPLAKGKGEIIFKRGESPSFKKLFPLSLEGEGD